MAVAGLGARYQKRAGDDPRNSSSPCSMVMDLWFNDPEFRGCMFINAAAEFPNPFDPVHQDAAAYLRLCATAPRLARAAGGALPTRTVRDCFNGIATCQERVSMRQHATAATTAARRHVCPARTSATALWQDQERVVFDSHNISSPIH